MSKTGTGNNESESSDLALVDENLSDEAKIGKYIEAFEMNLQSFEGKVVLNVGCGHGLLSMLAAKVGQSSIDMCVNGGETISS